MSIKEGPRGLLKNPKNMFSRLINYIKETRVELANTNWPSRKQAFNFTLLVIGFSLAVAIFLGAFDTLFAYLLGKFIF